MENYEDAAQRHFQDAKFLHEQIPSRLANASHLFGISAECALKCIMRGNNGFGKVPRGSSGHLPRLLREFKMHSATKGNAALLKRIEKCAEGLSGWSIDQRYYAQTAFLTETVASESVSAQKILALSQHHSRGVI
jgi:hypothetical protein